MKVGIINFLSLQNKILKWTKANKQTNKKKTQSYFMVGSQYRYFDSTWDLQFADIILYFSYPGRRAGLEE